MTDRYYAFPDIHGNYALLRKALDFVYQENPDGGRIVFLGDYIDRGDDNRMVLQTVMNPPENWEFICLKGNHEDMFLQAVAGRSEFYDLKLVREFLPGAMTVGEVQDQFPKDILNWMENLPLFHFEGNNVFAHANYDDSVLPSQQSAEDVMWTRYSDWDPFESQGNRLFLTHGHTPRKHGPVTSPNRVNLDCGVVVYQQYAIGEYQTSVRGPVNFHQFTWHDYR